MSGPPESVTLHGQNAENFRDVKTDLEARLGYQPSNAETVRLLMAGFDAERIGAQPAGIQR